MTKYFNAGLLVIKDQNYVQYFLPQFDLNYQGNRWGRYTGTKTTTTVKFIPTDINYTTTTSKYRSAPVTPQVDPQEHLIWNDE